MKLRLRRVALGAGAVMVAVACGLVYYALVVVPGRVDRAIAEARRSGEARPVRVTRTGSRTLGARREGIRAFGSTRDWRDGAALGARTIAATSGGVVILGPDGAHERTLGWADGAGAASFTAAVPFGDRVALGGGDGRVTLLGADDADVVSFEIGRAGAAVTDLAADGDVLYVGTYGAGLIVWDGRRAAALESVAGQAVGEITAIAVGDGGLAVGTSSGMVLVRRGGGRLVPLPREGDADRVTALAWEGDALWIGTPFELRRVVEDRVDRRTKDLFVTSILVDAVARTVYAGTFDAGVVILGADGESRVGGAQRVNRVRRIGERVVAFGPGGAWTVSGAELAPLATGLPATLAGAHVTALSVHGGEVWVGTFEDGIDVLGADDAAAPSIRRHLPPERAAYGLDQVNALEPRGREMFVATVRGAVRIGDATTRIGAADGLIGDQVQDLATQAGTVAYATNRGVTVIAPGGAARSLYAMQGLANNHCYAVAYGPGGKLFVGTLGGVSIVSGELTVERSVVSGKDGLRAGWVTALAPAPEGVYVGTYGGGVVRLGEDGRVVDVGAEVPRTRVNPGAMLVDGERLWVGTLEDGLLVYDRGLDRWKTVTLPLPSRSVTALAKDGEALWVGTDSGLVRIDGAVLEAALAPVPRS